MKQRQNAWITAVAPTVLEAETTLVEAPLPPFTGVSCPQKGIPGVDAADRLPRCPMSGSAPLWIVGVHGGAGETVITQLLEGARSTQHAWPVPEDPTVRPQVLLACRSNAHGLEAARQALIEWTSAEAPQVELLGLAVLADAPGKLPKPLRDLATIVGGGAPRMWHLPWVESWRTGDFDRDTLPRDLRKFITEITSLLP